jgi:hypothetical protein
MAGTVPQRDTGAAGTFALFRPLNELQFRCGQIPLLAGSRRIVVSATDPKRTFRSNGISPLLNPVAHGNRAWTDA